MPPAYSGLRILLVAKFNTRYHRTGYALRDALRALGCEVYCVEERSRWLDRLPWRSLASRLALGIGRHRPELVLVFKGEALAPEAIDRLRPLSTARWVNWFPDPPHVLELSLTIGRAYDLCFIFDTSMVERHRRLGRRAEYLAEGFDPSYHRPLPDPEWPRVSLAYVGSEEPLRDAVLDRLTGFELGIWGPGRPAGALYGDDFVRAFSNADIALNIHRFFGEPASAGNYGTGANRRVFELAGIGTVQLVDAKADVPRHFEPDLEVVLYRTPSELAERARWLLDHPALRAEIAARARARALAGHTWRHRLEELLAAALR